MRRQIIGRVYGTDDLPIKKGTVIFSRTVGSYTSSTQYPPDSIAVKTDENGQLIDCFLWVNEEGDRISTYTARVGIKECFNFSLPAGDGSPIELSALRAGSQPPQSYPQSIIDYIDDQISGVQAGATTKLFAPSRIATSNLSALRIINLSTGNYASVSNLNDAIAPLAFVENAVQSGQSFSPIVKGFHQDTSFNFQLNIPLFLGNDGYITQTIGGVFIKQLGIPETSSKILIDIEDSILLGV
jgi:hypothetical protein